MASGEIGDTRISSDDGTEIGWRSTGSGPGLVVVFGTLRAAKHYTELAGLLGRDFTVHTVDRGGRGGSGPQSAGYGIDTECADLAAALADTGARFLFGHSYGGLIALETLLRGPDTGIDALALYEPAVSIDHGIPFGWLSELDRAVAEGRTAYGVTILMSGLDPAGPLGRVPMRLRRVLLRTMLRGELLADMAEVLPTVHAEVVTAAGLDSSGARYTETLLLRGTRSPDYLRDTVDLLYTRLRKAHVAVLPKAGHNAPDLDAPRAVAEQLLAFFGRDR